MYVIQRGNDYTLVSNGKEYFGYEISELVNNEEVLDAKPYKSFKQSKRFGFNKK